MKLRLKHNLTSEEVIARLNKAFLEENASSLNRINYTAQNNQYGFIGQHEGFEISGNLVIESGAIVVSAQIPWYMEETARDFIIKQGVALLS